jgi:hypothetical protein
MAKSLSVDVFLAALAILSVTTVGCRKGESAAPAPEASGAANGPAAPTPARTPLAEPALGPAASAAVVGAVDAGRPAPGARKPSSASCGAGGCSPDMKKGGK